MIFAALIAAALLCGLEAFWRVRGFTPMPRDTLQLWALHRDAVRGVSDVVAVIGSSRAHLGLDPAVIGAEFRRPTVQLAITGGSPLPVLADLAADPEFRGVVLCEVTPSSFFIAPSAITSLTSGEWVRGARQLPLVSSIETKLRVRLQSHVVLLLQQTNLRFQLSVLMTKRALSPPPNVRNRVDRFQAADYSREDLPKTIAHWAEGLRATTPPTSEEQVALFARVRSWVEAIRARGGDVIFVRIPSSSTVYETEAELWPRSQFWDPFVAAVDSHAIYFADVPDLARFTAPEGSHMDSVQAAGFSRALARIILERRWLSD